MLRKALLCITWLVLGLLCSQHAHAQSALDGFNPSANDLVSRIVVQPDGKVLLAGDFTTINGTPRNRIARLNADGTLDTTFDPGAGPNGLVQSLALQPDGKVLLGGWFTTINGTPRNRIARLNADGSLDTTFNPSHGADNSVQSIAVQPDGKILLSGAFTKVNFLPKKSIARLNADGSLDTTFNPGGGTDRVVSRIALQPDGKVLLGGTFTNINGTPRNGIARLHADGALDASFNPGSYDSVSSLALQPDGKVLLAGNFTAINGAARNYIARLHADGSLDTTFAPNADARANNLALQPDGKVLLAGTFTTINGVTRNRIARLHADGTLDTSFDPGTGTGTGSNSNVYGLTMQADGKVLLGGDFTNVGGAARSYIARLNADGSLETNFDPGANDWVRSLVVQPDAKVLLAGDFTDIDGSTRNHIARLHADGALDTTFNPGTGADRPVGSIALQPDGKVLLGGFFTKKRHPAQRHRPPARRWCAGYHLQPRHRRQSLGPQPCRAARWQSPAGGRVHRHQRQPSQRHRPPQHRWHARYQL